MEKSLEDLSSKIKALKFRIGKSDDIIAKGDREALERQRLSVGAISSMVNTLKEAIEENMFSQNKTDEEVRTWAQTPEEILAEADQCVRKLTHEINNLDAVAQEALTRKEEQRKLEFEKRLTEQKLQREKEAAEVKRVLDFEHQQKLKEVQQTVSNPQVSTAAKMPKLIISKFTGTPQDWVRFWGQFESQIDKSSVDDVTKFSYLKELVDIKVRRLIDGLPFTGEGYAKARDLLQKRYGQTSEVVSAYVRAILELPTIKERDVAKIHSFYETLLFNVESLQTLDSLKKLDAAVRFTFDKLDVIKGELAMTNEKWSEWTFLEFVSALERWTKNNPIKQPHGSKYHGKDRDRSYFVKTTGKGCLYCSDESHKAISCDKIVNSGERKKILAEKQLCFNCAGAKHRAADCKSKNRCQTCHGKHHTSICDKSSPPREPGMTANFVGTSTVVHPVVVVRINGYKFRALLDSGASHSYASSTALKLIGAKCKSVGVRQIVMLTGVTTRKMQVYDAHVESLNKDFVLDVSLTKIEKHELLQLENPRYKEILKMFPHLDGVYMDDYDEKDTLPVHLILGANEYAKIRTNENLRVGKTGEPVAEHTRFGWALMSPGEDEVSLACLAVNSAADYENLSALDVLGLADNAGQESNVMGEFEEQLIRSDEGWYETALPWKPNHPPLLSNRDGSLRRLRSLLRKLGRTNMLAEYDAVIRDQVETGVVEKAPSEVVGKEFYLPHRAVVRENAETTKTRIVYDASAREREDTPSLNDCLLTGPPLQNQLWSVLIRNRFHPVALAGDLQKAFLQVRVREAERDVLRFYWIKDLHSTEVEVLRFTRVVFGLAPSPFLLNGVIQKHLETLESRYPESVPEVRKSLYVDDLISGAPTTEETKELKRDAIEIFDDAKFKLHKWHSNIAELESDSVESEPTFAKQQLKGSSTSLDSKLLGLPWDKVKDRLRVDFPTIPAVLTKRGVLAYLAKVYDPLGLVSPVLLEGKLIYRDICEARMRWDAPISDPLLKRWKKWEQALPHIISFTRSIPAYQEPLREVKLHSFGDASKQGVCAAVYAVVKQDSGVVQGLVAARSRLAKTNLTIPRLELVAGHMAVNLAVNVRDALQGLKIAKDIQCWLDSTVALHWLNDNGEYRQFVANRVNKMKSQENVLWRHVPTSDNPADLGSRGGSVTTAELWWNGPPWLADPSKWPPQIVTKASEMSNAERKVQRELSVVGVEDKNYLDTILSKFGLRKALRIFGWVSRFIHNSRNPSKEIDGAMTTDEVLAAEMFWVKQTQQQAVNSERFVEEKLQLNLQLNADGIWVCCGRIQGEYPLYLPDSSLFTTKLVQRAHVCTLHGGVGLVMAKVRERYWIPRLRRLAKKVISDCWGCKKFRAVPAQTPPPGPLPKARTEKSTPFNVIGVDFAGPVKYRNKGKESKSYVVLYSCSLIRAVLLDLLPSLETREFIKSFKRLIARRGRPSLIYSDNGSTFVAAAKWLKSVRKDEELNDLLRDYKISWRFNLSRAPWWGGGSLKD